MRWTTNLEGLKPETNVIVFLKTSALTEIEKELILAMGEENENIVDYNPSSSEEGVDLN